MSGPLSRLARRVSCYRAQVVRPMSTNLPDRRSPTPTPMESQFETWIHRLKPGHFTPADVDVALRAQADPDLALDIFRWAAQQRRYSHDSSTYLTMLTALVSGRRFRHAEALAEEVVAGACEPSAPLYNAVINFFSHRKLLFNRAFDVYKKMVGPHSPCRPTLDTYALLLSAILRRFNKLKVTFVYLHAVRSLDRQMKASGVIPDMFVLNMLIKAYSKCLEVDQALRVFRELGLYGCSPNAYSYGYLIRGMCEKGLVGKGFLLYQEMKAKGMVPPGVGFYLILISSLAMSRRFDDALAALDDMLNHSMSPDLLTYKTVLEGLCREGRGEEALELLGQWRKRDVRMGERYYNSLLDGLHFSLHD